MRQYVFHIKPQPGERVDTVISLPQDPSALICGTVLSPGGTPLAQALVLLLRQEDGSLQSSTVTDEDGRFYLGPVEPELLYTLRIQLEDRETRILELTLS